jgi:hypothetical protein
MIIYIGKTTIYFATNVKFLKFAWFPRCSYFDGGSYFKLSFYWFQSLIEFSRTKKNKCVYKKISFEEMEEILKKDFEKEKQKNERILLNE